MALLAVWFYTLEQNPRGNGYVITILERSAIYAIVAVAMNLMNGFTGLFSLGQAGFMAISAYVVWRADDSGCGPAECLLYQWDCPVARER